MTAQVSAAAVSPQPIRDQLDRAAAFNRTIGGGHGESQLSEMEPDELSLLEDDRIAAGSSESARLCTASDCTSAGSPASCSEIGPLAEQPQSTHRLSSA